MEENWQKDMAELYKILGCLGKTNWEWLVPVFPNTRMGRHQVKYSGRLTEESIFFTHKQQNSLSYLQALLKHLCASLDYSSMFLIVHTVHKKA